MRGDKLAKGGRDAGGKSWKDGGGEVGTKVAFSPRMLILRTAFVASALAAVCCTANAAGARSPTANVAVEISVADAATGKSLAHLKTQMDPRPIPLPPGAPPLFGGP